ncbi:NAD(P)-dependent oxidoreductase, partial [Klebsiella pneumoniae]|uniref:NAD-dependent epimerase/dehydratase family protein n=1 Tax=Klebsiella pneumoniae TaxID=573 RepID=UPI0033BE8168|nr:NAD(P)-dependent oxidoreductase [Klebsiella pneumoniae]
MSQSVLVLGASGYIGQHLVGAISARGDAVVGAARPIGPLEKLPFTRGNGRGVDEKKPA